MFHELGIKSSIQIDLSLNQFLGAYITLSFLSFSQAAHQLKLLLAMILDFQSDIKYISKNDLLP